MHLKSLTLKGFKSFANPTTFILEKGVTAVVGPNGSGKSNVVDALAWVMGEQGAKTLRGGKMEDVIFAGTATKGPLGRAEVSLTIDNTDGALPIDYTEVTISRTLFRNGGSEYAINGEPCRLLDVQELLSDTGLGREMHVIVGQGMLDGVLRATPEERRGFIEEAAGILKHRRRKEKTERKLEAMQGNLTRLNDLAGEVRRQLKPLSQQAETARQAQGIASVVRDAKARLMAAEVVALLSGLDQTSQSEADRKAERNILKQQLDENTSRLTELENEQMSSEVEVARSLAFSFDTVTEKFRTMLAIANQRVALLTSQKTLSASQVDPAAIEADAKAADSSVVELNVAVETLKGALRDAELHRDEARAILESFDNQAAQRSAEIAAFDVELARLDSEVNLTKAKLVSSQEELSRHEEALQEANSRHQAAVSSYESLESELSFASPKDSSYEQAYEDAQNEVTAVGAKIESLRDELHTAERERDSLLAKRSALNLTLEQKDGTTELNAAGLQGIRGLVASHMRIDAGFEAAISAALGTLADAIVADNRSDALSAIEHLKRNNGGRVELVVADVESKIKPTNLPQIPGARNAVDVVDAPSGILANLVNVVIVDDIAAARSLYSAQPNVAKLVSSQEELSRHEEALQEANSRHQAAVSSHESLESELSFASPKDSSYEQAYEDAQNEVTAVGAKIESLRDELHTAERERDSLLAKRSALNLTLEQKDGTTELNAAGLQGIRGLVASHMRIDAGFEAAISAALGTLADAIVADNRSDALSAIEHLKRNNGGRVELVVADVESKIKPTNLPQIPGARNAVDVVDAPSGILANLVNVVIVDDIAAARSLYSAQPNVAKLVVITKEGDVLTESVIRGGSGQQPSKVELVAERDSAETKLSSVTESIERLRADLNTARAQETSAKEKTARALAELKKNDAELASHAEKLGRLRVQVEALDGERARLERVADTAREGIAVAKEAVELAVANHLEFSKRERPNLDTSARVDLALALDNARQAELDVRVELGSATDRLRVESERAASLRAQIGDALDAIERSKAAAQLQARQLASAQSVLELLPVAITAIEKSAQIAKLALHDLESKRRNQNEELVRLRGETSTVQNRLSALTQTVHDIELSNHEKRLNLANLVSKASEELALDQQVLVTEYGPDQLIPDPENPENPKPFVKAEQQKRLHEAERLLERLGRVNPLALEEFAALEQRHKFLTEQLTDLTQTRADLMDIIKELDSKMQSIFEEAFEDTKKAFEQVFPVLFPGGTGSIYLTDHDNMLTTGLEVNVKPAGKRIERLSLLSGGERSLAALALLVAIFKARPSPFYVLDEVEAALDDANLGRLLDIFLDLKKSSQLVIITHQKRTMEIADALYGVSMRQDGISAVVSQRLEVSED